MFDAVRNNKKIVQGFLVLIMLPFAFFGIDSYVNNAGGGDAVALIDGNKISQQEFSNVMREQLDRLRGQLGSQFDPKMLETPEIRKTILDDLINRRLLLIESAKRHLVVGDDQVRAAVASIDAFQQDGKFSAERYTSTLAAQGLSPAGFEAQIRQDLILQQLAGSLGRSALVSRTVAERTIALQAESREVQELRLSIGDYLSKVKLADGAAKQYYEANARKFETPEQARAEFVVLSLDVLDVKVSEEEIKNWYEGHKDRYQQSEERRASHILIGLEKQDKTQARAKAEMVLKQVQAKPAAFAELAKQYSDDPGSASQGGDLGFFGRGMMVKPFEDSAFVLKDGEISGVVESDFGFHIIKLTGVHAAKGKPLAEVRGEIEDELKKTAASRKFAEAAETLANMAYEQSDSLQPLADRFKLKVQKSDWLGRQANPAAGVFANPKLLAGLFSDDVVKSKRNTEAVEIAPNTLVVARIAEHKPAAVPAFDELRTKIELLLQTEEAQKLALADGEAKLAALRKGDGNLNWGASKTVSRFDPRAIPPLAVQPVFRLDASKLPAYTGVEVPGAGYALFRLNKVTNDMSIDEKQRKGMLGQLTSMASQDDLQGYLAGLRTRYKVEINQKALESSDK